MEKNWFNDACDSAGTTHTALKRARGRPALALLDRARSAFWAWTVKERSGLDFAKLERVLSASPIYKIDGGGYQQPCAWHKYAKGERTPAPPSDGEKSPVLLAEREFPGTALAYQSITWDLIYPAEKDLLTPLQLSNRVSPYVLGRLDEKHIESIDSHRILLTPEGVARTVLIKHIDALGLLLMQWRNGTPKRLSIELVYFTRTWLLHAFEWITPFPECRHLLLRLFEENLAELGVLDGPGGLSLQKSQDERIKDAYWAAWLAGVVPIEEA